MSWRKQGPRINWEDKLAGFLPPPPRGMPSAESFPPARTWRSAPMLTLLGSPSRFCDGLSRRSFLQIGGLALGGLTLPTMLRAERQAGIRRSHKAIIMVYLSGGLAHQDTFDLKPN